MSDETSILKKIWLSVSSTTTLFRLNTGLGWVGKGKITRLPNGSALIPYARPISIGFALPNAKPLKGAADLIGWTTRIITQDMVGKKIAQFTSIEVKNSKGGIHSYDQLLWLDNINRSGGISISAKSPEEAQEKIKKYIGG